MPHLGIARKRKVACSPGDHLKLDTESFGLSIAQKIAYHVSGERFGKYLKRDAKASVVMCGSARDALLAASP